MSESQNTLDQGPSATSVALSLAPADRPQNRPAAEAIPSALAVRLWCGFVLFICAAMLGLGLYLQPDHRGLGTHQQLHFPPCGMYHMTGYPCPTCGCTTAVSYIAHGQWGRAFFTQPFGAAVGVLAIVLGMVCFVGLISGRWYGPSMFTLNWYWRSIFAVALGLLGAAWVFKILMIKFGYTG